MTHVICLGQKTRGTLMSVFLSLQYMWVNAKHVLTDNVMFTKPDSILMKDYSKLETHALSHTAFCEKLACTGRLHVAYVFIFLHVVI